MFSSNFTENGAPAIIIRAPRDLFTLQLLEAEAEFRLERPVTRLGGKAAECTGAVYPETRIVN